MHRELYNKILETNYNETNSECDCKVLEGYPIGYPTVKELINILKTLPEDYYVTCCGAENFIYIFPENSYITIDNEDHLVC